MSDYEPSIPMDDSDAWTTPLGIDDTQVEGQPDQNPQPSEPTSKQRSKTTATPSQDDDPVSAAIKAASPVLKSPSADSLAGFETEMEVKNEASNKAMSHPALALRFTHKWFLFFCGFPVFHGC